MRRRTLTFLLASLLFSWTSFAQTSPITDQIAQAHTKGVQFKSLELFNTSESQPTGLNQFVSSASVLDLDLEELNASRANKTDAIALSVPMPDGKTYELELVKTQVLSDDFILTASSTGDEPIAFTPAVSYRGIIKGMPGSMVAISLDETEVFGMISSPIDGNVVIGKIENSEENRHLVYYERDLLVENHSSCDVPALELSPEQLAQFRQMATEQQKTRAAASTKCVKVYFECEYNMFQEKGTVTNTANFMTNVFNVVALLYSNESISTQISQIKVWDTPDTYVTSSTTNALYDFRNKVPSFNGDLAHLISRGAPSGGGVAWVDALCSSVNYAYSYIYSSYSNYPTYSWTVQVITHEMGHNLGSPHTQNCSWSGGALDNCYTTEGGCAPGPAPTNGGTIMSYCHLTSNGINHANGFGTQPGNLIRSKVASASCLGTCGSTGGCQYNEYTLTLNTDNYGGETSWEVKNSSGSTVASGNGYSSNQTYNIDLCLPDGCYSLVMNDTWGDGMCCGYGNGSYNLTNSSGSSVASGGNFGSSETKNFCTSSSSPAVAGTVTSVDDIKAKSSIISLYPNPVYDAMNIAFNAKGEDAKLIIMDAVGRVVWERTYNTQEGSNAFSVNMSSFENGSYTFVIQTDFYIQQQGFVISK